MPPKFEDMWVVVIRQGEAAEAAINGVNKTIDSMTNTAVILVADMKVHRLGSNFHKSYTQRIIEPNYFRFKPSTTLGVG